MRPIYYDTETTGTRPGKDRIIELAAFDPVQDKTYVTLINPECPIPPESSAVCHITDDMVKGAPPLGAIADQFISFCEGDSVLIAHSKLEDVRPAVFRRRIQEDREKNARLEIHRLS